jgi:glyoxylase-like metal-dependent hydrolase (beta-lactamase superfamily II)
MGNLKVDHYVVGPVQTNCYVAVNADTKECFVVDPGAAAPQLAERIRRDGYTPVAVFLTHGHFDHAGAAEELAKEFGIQVYAHEQEEDTLGDYKKNLSGWEGPMVNYHADVYLKDEQELDLAGFHIRVLHTPGHTEGGICFVTDNEVFTGDTLFRLSVGNTSLETGSWPDLVSSIQNKLYTLDDNIIVWPGHGAATTIGYEKKNNPYVQE